MIFRRIAAVAAAATFAALSTFVAASADMVTVTDIAGRQVEVNVPV